MTDRTVLVPVTIPPVDVRNREGTVDAVTAVLIGVVIFVAGQAVVKFWIEPWYEFRALIGRIAHALVFYINVTDRPDLVAAATEQDARVAYRNLSGELWQRMYGIPGYKLWAKIFPRWVRSPDEIEVAAHALIGLSNSRIGDQTRVDHAESVCTGLRLQKII